MNTLATNGSMLAFVGDAYYELKIREMLIRRGINKSHRFHRLKVHYVSARAQAEILFQMIEAGILTETELDMVKKGRNTNSHSVPKNTDVVTYRQSTGFEALIGYLYLENQLERLEELIQFSINYKKAGEPIG